MRAIKQEKLRQPASIECRIADTPTHSPMYVLLADQMAASVCGATDEMDSSISADPPLSQHLVNNRNSATYSHSLFLPLSSAYATYRRYKLITLQKGYVFKGANAASYPFYYNHFINTFM